MAESVWVLFGNTGKYSDHREWVVRAYTKEADAKADCDALNEIAKGGADMSYEEREGVVARLRQHDSDATIDYTGADYFVSEAPLLNSRSQPTEREAGK